MCDQMRAYIGRVKSYSAVWGQDFPSFYMDIKVPMMKEIYKDKEHPMYVEAARILDATGELDEESGDAEEE